MKILTSHPIQYQAPLFRELVAAGLAIEVGFYHPGAAGRVVHDAEFGCDFEWDIDLLSGYPSRTFLRGTANFLPTEQLRVARKLIPWVLRDNRIPLLLMGWSAEVVWVAWLLRILMHSPVLILAETTPLSFVKSHKPKWRVKLLQWLLRHTSGAIFIGIRNREFLLGMGIPVNRLFHAPYSIDNERFRSNANRMMAGRRDLCRQYGLDLDLPVFLFCGKLIPKKRPVQLFTAYLAADLKDRAQLLYVGEGELRGEIENGIRSASARHVHLIGMLNQAQMPIAYVLGEVLCLISDPGETWGLVVNEALACGRPVIVADTVGCVPDLVSDKNGWVVPLDNDEILTDTLLSAYNHRNKWKEMGIHGQSLVARNTFSTMASGFKAAVSSISV